LLPLTDGTRSEPPVEGCAPPLGIEGVAEACGRMPVLAGAALPVTVGVVGLSPRLHASSFRLFSPKWALVAIGSGLATTLVDASAIS
jgi:hypothetical protein